MARLYQPPFATVERYFRARDIHEEDRLRDGDELLALVLSLLWSFLHGMNMYWLFWNDLPFVYSLIIHVLLTVIISVMLMVLKTLARDVRHLYILAVSSAGAGVFGAVGTLLATLLTLIYNRFSLPFAEWYRAIYPDFGLSHEELLYDLINMGKDESSRHYSVVAFMDVIALGTELQKRRAITRMTDHFHPSFAPAFRLALQDESNTIRVQAASCITKIEHQFTFMLMRIEQLEARYPDDAVLKLGLARYYDAYAFTGLLDPDREEENRLKALQKFKEYLELKPDDIDARIEVGRLLIRSGQYQQVIQMFRDAIEAGHSDSRLKLWMLEALYAAGRYDDLRRMVPECLPLLEELKDVRPRLTRSIAFWGKVAA